MHHTKILINTMLVFTVLVACASTWHNDGDQGTLDNKPKHHTREGYQNYPFVETAAPKGVAFYLRRAWDSLFVPDIPDGHQLTSLQATQLLNSIDSNRIPKLPQDARFQREIKSL